MYVRVCICMYVCMYMCICVCICIYVCMCVCMYVCICMCVYVCMYVGIFMCVHMCVFVCMCVCMWMCACVCVCVWAACTHQLCYAAPCPLTSFRLSQTPPSLPSPPLLRFFFPTHCMFAGAVFRNPAPGLRSLDSSREEGAFHRR